MEGIVSQDHSEKMQLTEVAADLVAAYVTTNMVPTAELPALIQSVYASISGLNSKPPEAEKPIPAVPIKKSVTPDYLISLEDGRRFKSLKRHLNKLGMTPAEYRAKWSLPSNYPMVAESYAARRSELAKSLGLGQQRRKTVKANPKPKRGRKAA
jgi:predicted transcriptional regulator